MPATNRIEKILETDAPVARVWQALTDYNEFGQWFRVRLDQPFEAGADSTGEMTYPGHEGVPWFAMVETLNPNQLFSFRWFDTETGRPDFEGQQGLLVEFRLQDLPRGTRVTIVASGFETIAEPRRSALLQDNEQGWEIQRQNLTEYLSIRPSHC